MIQGQAVVNDVIMPQPKGVETKGSDAKIPDKKDGIDGHPPSPDLIALGDTDGPDSYSNT